ncbi:MAG: glycosyltransferase family 9 protein [Planctomycetaceae bacterium]|nr:glycosyltransferase family 9 protein [Planctomycetaceae bacterium]
MDVRFQKFVDRWAGIPVCAALSLWHFGAQLVKGRFPSPPPRRILVILLSEMGSLVLAEPMFRRLRERHPAAEIHMMLFKRNRQLLDLLGVVDPANVITIRDDSLSNLLRDLWAAIKRMRATRYDAVVDCELFSRISAILSGLSGAPQRVGFHRYTQEGLFRGSFMTAPIPYNPYRHLSHQLVALADGIDSQSWPRGKDGRVADSFVPPVFTPEPGELQKEAGQLHRDHPSLLGKPLVLLYPSGGLLPIRAWPLQHYVQVAQGLLSDGFAVGIIGMPDDRALGDQLRAACDNDVNCVNLAGYTRSVRHLMTLFHRASMLITNDGGPGQFAAMTPIQTIVFFGPETPALYRSWSPHAHAFFTALPCAPCLTAYNHRSSPCDGDNQCLKRILPGEVLAKARDMLKRATPAAVDAA